MTGAARIYVQPAPTPEEAAAIVAVLEALHEGDHPSARRDRWRIAGLLGHAPPVEMKLEGSLWSYFGRRG